MTVPTSISASDVIYLDNNATTPLAPEVLHAINSSAANAFANPSSSSLIGRAAKKLIIQSRAEVAQMINADPFDIIFTSGGTEANNWIIYSVLKYYYNEAGSINGSIDEAPRNVKKLPHIVTTQVEHDSVSGPINRLIDEKKVEASFIPVDPKTGSVSVEKVLASLRDVSNYDMFCKLLTRTKVFWKNILVTCEFWNNPSVLKSALPVRLETCKALSEKIWVVSPQNCFLPKKH